MTARRAATARGPVAGAVPDLLTFLVPGPCYSKPRPRVTVNGAYYPDHAGYEKYQADIQVALMETLGRRPEPDPTARWRVTTVFYLSGEGLRQDGDNLQGAVLDALNGWLWTDDRRVMTGAWEKRSGNKPQHVAVLVTVKRLP